MQQFELHINIKLGRTPWSLTRAFSIFFNRKPSAGFFCQILFVFSWHYMALLRYEVTSYTFKELLHILCCKVI